MSGPGPGAGGAVGTGGLGSPRHTGRGICLCVGRAPGVSDPRCSGYTSPFPPPRTLLQAAPTPQTHPRLLSAPCLLPGFVPATPGLACASQPRWDYPKRLLVLSQTSGHAASACSYSPRSGFPKSQLGWPQRGARGSPSTIKMCKVNPNSNPISNPSPSPRACRAPGWEQCGGKAEQLPSLQPQVKLQPYRISDSRGTAGWGRASCAPLPTPSTHAARFGAFGTGMRLNRGLQLFGARLPAPKLGARGWESCGPKAGGCGAGKQSGEEEELAGPQGKAPAAGLVGTGSRNVSQHQPQRNPGTALPHPGEHLGCCCSGGRRRAPSLPGGCGTRDAPGCGVTGTPGAAVGCG